MQHYLLIAADRQRMELYTREEPGWRLQIFSEVDAEIPLSALDINIALADIYDLVEFEAEL